MTTPTETLLPLLVAETFGPTFQGEGPRAGQQALFVRLSRCNLSCPACDTPYTWDTSRFDLRQHTVPRTAESIVEWALGYSTPLVVITGGEPLLQHQALLPVIAEIAAAGRQVEVETNGTVVPGAGLLDLVTNFNVSPKLIRFAAARDMSKRICPEALASLAASGKAVFKFVVTDEQDLDEIAHLQERFDLNPVWVMPEGSSSEVVIRRMRNLAEPVLARGWNLTSRLHVLLWEDTRGR